MKRIALAVVAALGLAFASGSALAQHGGHDGGGHSGGAWHGGGGHGGNFHGGGHFHGGSRFSIGIGFPGFYWGPGFGYPSYGYYGYPYYTAPYYAAYPYYDAAPFSYDSSEPEYIEQGSGAYTQRDMNPGAPQGQPQYSYYCPDPAGYYPQLQSCPKGWLRVVPDRSPGTRPQ